MGYELQRLLEKMVNEMNEHVKAIQVLRNDVTQLQYENIQKDEKIKQLESTIVDLQILK